jgi:catechol 2,3-dioxygenase-like lactoylglutathione lyase family enzyme
MGTVSVRYIVDDVEAAIGFYTELLGFEVELHPAPGFAMLSRGDLQLLLEVENLPERVEALRAAKARFRNDTVSGQGGRQILLEDPAGNPIELFEPAPR